MTTHPYLLASLLGLATVSCDQTGGTSGPAAGAVPARVQSIHSRNEAPTAPNATIRLTAPGVYEGTLPGTDPDGDPVTFELIRASGPFNLIDPTRGTFTYTAPANGGTDASIVYRVVDSAGLDDLATLTVRTSDATRYRR